MATAHELERVRDRLRYDTPFYAEQCLNIVGPGGKVIALHPKPAQLRLDVALEQQRLAGRPQRAIVLKARKLGFSTWTQAKLIQRVTQQPNHKALVVAQDNDTAGELFDIGRLMYARLPGDVELGIKPPIRNQGLSKGGMKYLAFGERSRLRQEAGDFGLNSSYEIGTARDVQAGRGYTYRSLHLSEVAFWEYASKLTSLLNAVPDEPGTLVVIESTANGLNHFKSRWDRAVAGESEYAPVFAPWQEERAYRFAFPNRFAQSPEEFMAEVCGKGPFGEDEPRLVEEFGCDAEQLAWRRVAIVDKCDSKVETFKQEYPASPEEAFVASGKHVFALTLISRVLDRTRRTDPEIPGARIVKDGVVVPPDVGILRAAKTRTREVRHQTFEVPTAVEWTPRAATGFAENHPWWRIWEHPVTDKSQEQLPVDDRRPAGQYIVAADVMSGEENDSGDLAWHAVQVIDHRTRRQVAEYRSRIDADELAMQLYMAGLAYGEAWIVVETTGGWGISIVQRLYRDMGYRFVYTRRAFDDRKQRETTKLGWDTNRRTKPLMEDGMRELLREGTHGIRSALLARELTTYVRDERGRSGPQPDAFSDLLMAYMIGQEVAVEKPLRPERRRGATRMTRRPVNPKTGY